MPSYRLYRQTHTTTYGTHTNARSLYMFIYVRIWKKIHMFAMSAREHSTQKVQCVECIVYVLRVVMWLEWYSSIQNRKLAAASCRRRLHSCRRQHRSWFAIPTLWWAYTIICIFMNVLFDHTQPRIVYVCGRRRCRVECVECVQNVCRMS